MDSDPWAGIGSVLGLLSDADGSPGVKADRMVRRFVADALRCDEQDMSQADAHELVTEAAGLLGLSVSQVGFAIWLHQSGNAPT